MREIVNEIDFKYRKGQKRDQKRGGIVGKLKGKCGPAG